MSKPYRLERAAAQDLKEVTAFLAQEANEATALRFIEAARKTFEFVNGNARVGRLYQADDSRLEGIRVWRIEGFQRYLVLYRFHDFQLTIERVVYATRDLSSLLV